MIWLKWSWRDLRSRWVQVAAIAIVIAVGTGLFSGLRSMNVWRGLSNDASYEAANTFDLRVSLSAGSLVDRGTLLDTLSEIDSGAVAVAEERLILPTQVSIETDGETILVPGRIVGVDLTDGGPHVNSLYPQAGRKLTEEDTGLSTVTLEHNFSKFYKLPAQGSALLDGGVPVDYVGQSLAPEYFFVITPEGGILAQANFAAVFTSIETAQQVTSMDRKVNDLILRLGPGADEDALLAAMSERFSQMGGTVTRRLDDPSIRLMVEDVEGDRQFNTVLAIAIFGGAVFAAFNLTSRIVDSQRREIGVAMALGVPTPLVALRPLLFSAQVALLGVVFGIAMGIGVAEALGAYLSDFLPLPAWRTPFQFGVFAAAGIIGFLVPFLATALPVWNGVRVAPIDAIRTGHLADRKGRNAQAAVGGQDPWADHKADTFPERGPRSPPDVADRAGDRRHRRHYGDDSGNARLVHRDHRSRRRGDCGHFAEPSGDRLRHRLSDGLAARSAGSGISRRRSCRVRTPFGRFDLQRGRIVRRVPGVHGL